MKNSLSILLGFLSISILTIHAQPNIMGTVAGKNVQIQSAANGVVTSLPLAPAETVGEVYLDSYWRSADITLTDQTELKGYPIKVNFKTSDLEIQYERQTKVLPGSRVSHFAILNADGSMDKYINGKNHLLNNVPVRGFLQVLDSGKWSLLKKTDIKIIEASYNPALAVGQRDNQIVKSEASFLSHGNMLYELDGSAKKFSKQFAGHEAAISKFMKEEKINLKKTDGAAALLRFLNEKM